MVKIIQHYTLHEQIGQGEYGKVFRGVDSRSGKQVAAKVIAVKKFKDNPKLQQCTLNEIQVLNKVRSPHIIAFIEILKTVNNFYFFYQYCNGGTLEQAIKKSGHLNQTTVKEYFSQLLKAFKSLTNNNIMHRDLKPSNILLHNGVIKIGDFGFCKSLQNQRDLAQTMLGSPIYMAPQVLRGQIYTIKADIWSLGVVLYQMCFGFCPFQQSSIARLINVLQYQSVVINRDINPISSHLQQLINKMLVKDHFKRISWQDLYTLEESGNGSGKKDSPKPLAQYNRLSHKRHLSQDKLDGENAAFRKRNFSTLKESNQEGKKQEGHKNISQLLKIVDRVIQANYQPELTLGLAVKMYRIVVKEHSKLGGSKQYVKQRVQLNQAVKQMESLSQNMQEDLQRVDSFLRRSAKQKSWGQQLQKLLSYASEQDNLFNKFRLGEIESVLRDADLFPIFIL